MKRFPQKNKLKEEANSIDFESHTIEHKVHYVKRVKLLFLLLKSNILIPIENRLFVGIADFDQLRKLIRSLWFHMAASIEIFYFIYFPLFLEFVWFSPMTLNKISSGWKLLLLFSKLNYRYSRIKKKGFIERHK